MEKRFKFTCKGRSRNFSRDGWGNSFETSLSTFSRSTKIILEIFQNTLKTLHIIILNSFLPIFVCKQLEKRLRNWKNNRKRKFNIRRTNWILCVLTTKWIRDKFLWLHEIGDILLLGCVKVQFGNSTCSKFNNFDLIELSNLLLKQTVFSDHRLISFLYKKNVIPGSIYKVTKKGPGYNKSGFSVEWLIRKTQPKPKTKWCESQCRSNSTSLSNDNWIMHSKNLLKNWKKFSEFLEQSRIPIWKKI